MKNIIYLKQYSGKILIPLFPLFLFISCASFPPVRVASFEYKIPEVFNFNEEDLKKNLDFNISDNPGYKAVIVFYSYFPVVEVMTYSGDDLIIKTKPGELKALIRVMDNDTIVKVHFVEVKGEGKDNLLREFSKKAALLLSELN